MKKQGLVDRMTAYNKAIGEPVRMKMIKLLGSHDEYTLNVSAIAQAMHISQPAATKHLKIMENVGVFDRERVGTSVYYSLNWDALEEYRSLIGYAFEHAQTPCEHDFDCKRCPFADTCV